MQLETLTLFCDVVKLGSFSKGAAMHQISQSSASQAVQQLEEHLGQQLIDRSHRPFELTPQGKVFYHGCLNILEQYRSLEEKVRQQRDKQRHIRIAAIYSAGFRGLTQYAKEFKAEHPETEVHIEFLHPDQVYQNVMDERVDFGVISFPHAKRGLDIVSWKMEPMVLALPPRHPLAESHPLDLRVPFDQLDGLAFVHFCRDLVIHREIDRFMRAHNISVDVVLEFDNVEAIKRAVEAGAGIAILPRPLLADEEERGSIAVREWEGEPFFRPLALVHRHGKIFDPGVSAFMEGLCRHESKHEQKAVS